MIKPQTMHKPFLNTIARTLSVIIVLCSVDQLAVFIDCVFCVPWTYCDVSSISSGDSFLGVTVESL